MTSNPDFKGMPLLVVEYPRSSTI